MKGQEEWPSFPPYECGNVWVIFANVLFLLLMSYSSQLFYAGFLKPST